MSLWDKFFGKSTGSESGIVRSIQLGRFTDANKSLEQHEAWDASVTSFEKKDYRSAFDSFFEYISNEEEKNIVKIEAGKEYQVLQGSKAIHLFINKGHFQAVCKVAHTNELHIGLMRRLLDLNYELRYVRYGLSEDNIITLQFESNLQDASPYKLYFALKEMAIHADKQDDLLVHEFDFLKPLISGKTEWPSAEELDLKENFLRTNIDQAIRQYQNGKLKAEQYPIAAGYILLATLYKLDYLVKPEGKLMDRLENMHKTYFSINQYSILQRLHKLKSDLEYVGALPADQLRKDLYHSVFTFGFTAPANNTAAFEIIDRELQNVQWYLDNKYEEYVVAIMEYATGLSLYNFALPDVLKELFTVVYRVTEPAFFKSIAGLDSLLNTSLVTDKTAVKDAIVAIENKYKSLYPALDFDYRSLNYTSTAHFLISYLKMVRKASYHKSK